MSGWSWSTPTLESGCCGCLDLRTTSFIMGYINLVITVIFCAIMVLGIALGAMAAIEGTEEMSGPSAPVLMVMSAITLVFCVIMLAFVITLLVGLHKTRRNLLKVFLIGAGIIYLFNAIQFFVGVFMHTENGLIVGVRAIILAIQVYTYFVVRSYFLKMEPSGEVATFTNKDNS